jgi:hypothetical protein
MRHTNNTTRHQMQLCTPPCGCKLGGLQGGGTQAFVGLPSAVAVTADIKVTLCGLKALHGSLLSLLPLLTFIASTPAGTSNPHPPAINQCLEQHTKTN